MSDLVKEYIQISTEVKQMIESMPVVFPARYAELFRLIAHEHEIDLKPEQFLSHEMLDEQMVRYVITLVECTQDALLAIESEDKELLKVIILKTKELQNEVESLQKIIYEDALTHTYNRKWFEDKLLDSTKIRLREKGILVLVDLNKFKEINDLYGHIVGDKVLAQVVLKLSETGGRVIRYGGDEFIVVFHHDLSIDEVKSKLEKLLAYFNKIHFQTKESSFKVSFAYGIAPFEDSSDAQAIITEADKAMYRHKREYKDA